MLKNRYDFPALLHYTRDGRIGITFPDLPGCVSQAHSDGEAVSMATEALELHIYGMVQSETPVPNPSRLSEIPTEPDQRTILVTAIMPLVRGEHGDKSRQENADDPRVAQPRRRSRSRQLLRAAAAFSSRAPRNSGPVSLRLSNVLQEHRYETMRTNPRHVISDVRTGPDAVLHGGYFCLHNT